MDPDQTPQNENIFTHSRGVFVPTGIALMQENIENIYFMKTCLFKYTENFTSKK